MINQERIKNLLLELVRIDSHSRKEREVAERLKKYCEELGAQVLIDDAGEKVGGNSGNVIARSSPAKASSRSLKATSSAPTGRPFWAATTNPAAPSSSKPSAV